MIEERGWGSRAFDVFNHIFVILLSVLCILPMVHLLAVSFSDRAAAVGGFVIFWPIRFTTESYEKVLKAGAFFSSLTISVQRTVLGTALNMLLTVLIAYPLSKTAREFKGRNVFMWLFLFAMFFSGGLIPWFLVIRSLGMLNTLWALIIPSAVPIWNVIIMMNFFRDIPRDLEEAAVIDGASQWRVLWNVYLPISLPALATLTLFASVNHWNAWFDGMILMLHPDKYPLQTFLRTIVIKLDISVLLREHDDLMKVSNRSLRAAQIFVTIIPILVVYPFLQKYFVTGLRLGAIKG